MAQQNHVSARKRLDIEIAVSNRRLKNKTGNSYNIFSGLKILGSQLTKLYNYITLVPLTDMRTSCLFTKMLNNDEVALGNPCNQP